jgi:phosphoribosylformimino-5-aminoimidazole carboxamide ribotide isomerase
MNVIPAIDLRGGRCVRLFQGEFDRETEYSTNPASVARQFSELGVENLHIVDLDGARDGRQQNQKTVGDIAAESPLAIQLGGGIRDSKTLDQWLRNGVSRCVIGSAAVTDPARVKDWLTTFGPAKIVLALDVRIDARGSPMLSTHGWEKTSAVSLWDCVEDYQPTNIRHVLCTDVSRDGAMRGPNFELYESFTARFPEIALQASGGVRGKDDLLRLNDIGVAAAITGRALLDGALTTEDVRSFQRDA